MAFTPILQNQPISYAAGRTAYRNSARETLAGGSPVFFSPKNTTLNDYGYGGPRYQYGYTYYNSSSRYEGNCTWWCWGRLYETMGTALPNYGDASNWYNRYTGSKETNANNIQAGDIIVFTDGGAGHVMFVEQVSGNTIYISQSAYSTRSIWTGRSCIVGNYLKSDIYAGSSINMYKGTGDSAYYQTVIGVIHTGGSSPGPTPTASPAISVSPSSYTTVMDEDSDYVDMSFTLTVTGIPENEDASDAISFLNCYRYMYTSNWVYTNYSYGGDIYRQGVRSLIVRYDRQHDYAYNATCYMYYRKTFSNGSINNTTTMNVTVKAKNTIDEQMIEIINAVKKKRRRFFSRIY